MQQQQKKASSGYCLDIVCVCVFGRCVIEAIHTNTHTRIHIMSTIVMQCHQKTKKYIAEIQPGVQRVRRLEEARHLKWNSLTQIACKLFVVQTVLMGKQCSGMEACTRKLYCKYVHTHIYTICYIILVCAVIFIGDKNTCPQRFVLSKFVQKCDSLYAFNAVFPHAMKYKEEEMR